MEISLGSNLSAVSAKNTTRRKVSGVKKAAEKLSSGLSINRSADNASGLAVSEKMRAQIRGLSQATVNVNDGISLVQTADGALGETHAILQRMRELAVQAANGTYTDDDRQAIQLEVDALKSEVDRIAQSTEFNNIKLLDGTTQINVTTAVNTNEYGALYGSVNHGLAIGGGKVTVASSIAGMYLEFTTGASGKGGENALWCYDYVRTGGELTQHVKINLAEGESYTDEQIRKLIDNASVPKNFPAGIGKISFSSETGIITAAECETYGLLIGEKYQTISNDLSGTLVGETKRYEIRTKNVSKEINVDWNNTDTDCKADSAGNISLNPSVSYSQSDIIEALKNAGFFDNNNKTQDGSAADDDGYMDNCYVEVPAAGQTKVNASYSEKYEQEITDYHCQGLTINATALQYGSYDECQADEEKYRQPDSIDFFNTKALSGITVSVSALGDDDPDILCEMNGDELSITIKDGYTTNDVQSIISVAQGFLNDNGYNYALSGQAQFATVDPSSKTENSDQKIIFKSGSSSSTITEPGKRAIKRVGTVAGERQVLGGSLAGLGTVIEGSSDTIRFTAETYGSSNNNESLVSSIAISTDAQAGNESVSINGKNAVIHLATGTDYSQQFIKQLLDKSGLMYDVSLSDDAAPDGDKDGVIRFTRSGTAYAMPVSEGQGVGISDVANITEGITFQIGANGTEDQQVTMETSDAGSAALGVSDISVQTVDKANSAIYDIDKAVNRVSMQRAKFGAMVNRLEHTAINLTAANENLTAAESTIRDTDMAAITLEYTKENILQQASQAMLAQANQQTQNVLQLLNF